MDESTQELENELKRLRPRRLSTGLVDRLDAAIAGRVPARRYTTATTLRSWKWAGWSLAGVMAAVALTFFADAWQKEDAAPRAASPAVAQESFRSTAPRYEPLHASSVLYDLREDGETLLPDNTPARQVRYRYVDTYTWTNPTTKASLRWSLPRDEVRILKASLD